MQDTQDTISVSNQYQFLSGGGEMGKLMRSKDWSASIVGHPETWPQSLRTTLSIILNSKFPMFLFWGPELVCFYNDAYRPSLGKEGKHPAILGSRGEDYWKEIWTVIKPLIDQVLAGGEATWSEDQLIPIYRNGQLEDVYWTFSYSPVNDESGKPAGVFVTCNETTEKVLTRKKLEESNNQLQFAIDAAQLGTWDYNPLTNKFTANDRLKNWFGLPPDNEIELHHAIDVIAENDRQRTMDAIKNALDYNSGGNYDIEYTIIQPRTGKELIVQAKGKAWFTDEKTAYRFNGTLEDVTEHVRSRRNIEENEKRLSIVIDASALGTWELNLKTREVGYSSRYLEILGFRDNIKRTHQELIRRIHPDDLAIREEAFKKAFATGYLLYESRLIWDDGSIHWVEGRGKVFYDEQHQPVRMMGTARDITEEKRIQQELKDLDKQKDYFISMASHELKTPITSIKGYVQLLQTMDIAPGNAFFANSLRVIDKQVTTLTKLITDLLDLSKIKSGTLDLYTEIFDMCELAREIIDELEHVNPEYIFEFSNEPGSFVCADRERIGQVLRNLLTNAVKYSPFSKLVKLTCAREGENVVISVADAGIGIKKTDQEKIFERFYRAEGKNEKTFPGFGIGLFISSEIIQRHNGKIGVESEPGKGSVFYFTLPVKLS